MTMNDFLLEASSINFHNENREELLGAFQQKALQLGVKFGVQLHNDENQETIDFLHRNHVPLSGHSPLLEKYNWNFAATDIGHIWPEVENNVKLFEKLNISRSCFHGFYMSDKPVEAFGHGKSYGECMAPHYREELAFAPGSVRNRNFTESGEFLMRRDRVKCNIAELRRRFPQIEWSIEVDFPAYSAGSMLAKDMNYLDFPLCLDTGHLWCICKLMDREFHAEVNEFLEGGNVQMIHLHASIFNDSYPAAEWGDGHKRLNTPNVMDLPRFVKNCAAHGVRHFVMEIFDSTPDDLELLANWLRS